MAEICSSLPTTGGVYYWAGVLGGKQGPLWSWVVGWLNLLGQVRLEWVGGCRRAAWFACLPAGLPACLLSQLLPGGC